MDLGSGNTGRYEGNISRGSLLNLDFLPVPPMSDDHHHDHHPDHDDDHADRDEHGGEERL
jgi:ABC-type Zn2+ transport system substrate-binding protein/surface adhesin